MNEIISDHITLHMYSCLVSIYDYFLGCLLWCQYRIQHTKMRSFVFNKRCGERMSALSREENVGAARCVKRWARVLTVDTNDSSTKPVRTVEQCGAL
jgi:hypothetical protein